MSNIALRFGLLVVLMVAGLARADPDRFSFSNNTRYLALGDSLAAGFGALPATRGYAYLLYLKGVYDTELNTSFANAAVPGAKSSDVLAFQVPQAIGIFRPHVITISVGGNDLLRILNEGADPNQVLQQFAVNLNRILCGLRDGIQGVRVYVHNLYDIPEITETIPGGLQAILAFNKIVAGVAFECNATVADVFSAFQGRQGLLIIDRKGHELREVHPTNIGYRVIADAFEAVR